ncbi:hypothetical protein QVD17_35925 [Tagetes erecta]|uniref:Legume lectin domain-containing protein n=1 Tax=Tagetes erecta TaxID=13708 RepID=A0AAD8NGX4_TARER|nr:hypothetical protein QVD17_35925 [Tagetes erecta]
MMASFSVLIPSLLLLSLSAIAITITIPPPDTDAGNSLSGDAHFISDETALQHIQPTPSNFNLITQTTSFNSSSITSLSTNFTFQIRNGVALVIIPARFTSNSTTNVTRFIRVEFHPKLCSVSCPRVRNNVSKNSNVLKHGVKLSAWVDYSAISKRLDVKLSKLGDPKPVKSLISYRIDLGDVFKGEKVFAGLALSTAKDHEQIMPASSTRFWFDFVGDSEKTIRGEETLFKESVNEKREPISVYSWSYEIEDDGPKLQLILSVSVSLESSVASEFVVLATGSALAALVMYLVWSCVVDWSKALRKTSVQRSVDFKFEKVDDVEVKGLGTGMK